MAGLTTSRCVAAGGERQVMGFFGRDDGESDPSEAAALDRLRTGRVPFEAESRLSDLGADFFSSTLSVNEFAVLSDLGPVPLAQVLGASVHQVGWQYLPAHAQWVGNDLFCQMYTVSQAWAQARQNAFGRIREEARLAGADAVVGVQLRRATHDWARHSVDLVVNGTAIRLPDSERSPQAPVVLSDLSAQEYWKLSRGGWAPAGFVAATSVFFVSQGSGTRWQRRMSVMNNQELVEFSDGFSAARRAVVTDLRGQAESVKADGIVGMSFQYAIKRGKFPVAVSNQPTGLGQGTIAISGGGMVRMGGAGKREGLVITMHAVGTAIRRQHTTSPSTPRPMLSLGGAL